MPGWYNVSSTNYFQRRFYHMGNICPSVHLYFCLLVSSLIAPSCYFSSSHLDTHTHFLLVSPGVQWSRCMSLRELITALMRTITAHLSSSASNWEHLLLSVCMCVCCVITFFLLFSFFCRMWCYVACICSQYAHVEAPGDEYMRFTHLATCLLDLKVNDWSQWLLREAFILWDPAKLWRILLW